MANYGQSQPMSELEMLRMKANERQDETLASTQRMVGMAEESRSMGAATMEQLHHQGQQIDRVNTQMDTIHEDIKKTEQDLDNLEKCCGLFVLPWKRVKRPGTDKQFKAKDYSAAEAVHSTQPRFHYNKNKAGGGTLAEQTKPDGPFITRILDDDRETEMEDNLGKVSNIVGDLRSMAVDMNQEINVHNRKLDDIAAKTDANQARLNAAQAQATRIVGKPAKKDNDPLIPQPGVGMVAKQMANQAMK